MGPHLSLGILIDRLLVVTDAARHASQGNTGVPAYPAVQIDPAARLGKLAMIAVLGSRIMVAMHEV
jgi:hypothetical protein